jgi:hypothetical protein
MQHDNHWIIQRQNATHRRCRSLQFVNLGREFCPTSERAPLFGRFFAQFLDLRGSLINIPLSGGYSPGGKL